MSVLLQCMSANDPVLWEDGEEQEWSTYAQNSAIALAVFPPPLWETHIGMRPTAMALVTMVKKAKSFMLS